ncbi:Glycoside hydrolase, family 35 [Penicillium occitanis (nom. inval.)]|nr:Glycoside hydrolase, family 35 [Penicillium occitanis (nom. inval.)]PCH06677.1 hypothetical protein PENOC_023130 [Penicillium occitanis (nom. inval.)]
MGLNTIFSYIFWNELEPSPGVWDWNGIRGMNDIAAWYQAVQDAGLQAVLRPGGYICGERDWGGMPAWLSQIQNLTVRSNNPQFLEHSDYYFGNLSQQISKYQVSQGGPILLAQVENEYGQYGSDHAYTAALSALIAKHFNLLQYTNDGGSQTQFPNGPVHGVLAEIDGDPYQGFATRKNNISDPTEMGPNLDGEYYFNQKELAKWLTTWGSNSLYPTVSGIGYNNSAIVAGASWILNQASSFSLYMFHGGTNFAFSNGGLNFGQLEAVTPSYDYGAPLDESGRPRELYWELRSAIANYTGKTPNIVQTLPMSNISDVPLRPVAALLEESSDTIKSDSPINMEQLGQSYGYILYRYQAPYGANISGQLHPGDGPRDRVLVYVNGNKQGVIDATYYPPQNVTIQIVGGDVLELLVENQGRVDYSSPLLDQRKGIIGDVYIGSNLVSPWTIQSYPVPTPPQSLIGKGTNHLPIITVSANSTPVWYKGNFKLDGGVAGTAAADTFLSISGGIKGVLYVNGYNLGKYWTVGPAQSQYVPGAWLREDNEIIVLELEPQVDKELVASGSSERVWYNNPDPDCVNCKSANPNP